MRFVHRVRDDLKVSTFCSSEFLSAMLTHDLHFYETTRMQDLTNMKNVTKKTEN